jgi:hypothetical protein
MKGNPLDISNITAYAIETRIASDAGPVRNPGSKAIPPSHIEYADNPHRIDGVFIAFAQVLRFLIFGHPWRMKAIDIVSLRTSKPEAAIVELESGNKSVAIVV